MLPTYTSTLIIYPEPDKWISARYLPGREEDKKRPIGWLGWSAGCHPCVGMKFVRLEQNIIIAYWLAMYDDFRVVDEKGNVIHEAPATDFNAHASGKLKDPVYLKYEAARSF